MIVTVVKRDGRIVGFNKEKICAAIRRAMLQTEKGEDESLISKISDRIELSGREKMTVEEIQDEVELQLMKSTRKDVAQKYIARQLITYASTVLTKAFDSSVDVADLMQESESTLFNLSRTNLKKDFTQINPIITDVYRMLREAAARDSGLSGITTGFEGLDKMTNGWQKSDLIIIAARPAMGKTAFVLNIAQHVAFKANKSVAIFSLEMSKEQLVNRLFAMESMVSSQNIRTGNLSDKEWEKLIEGATAVGNSRIIIDDTGSISISELRSKCRKFKLEHGLDMIMIDYLQLMTGSGKSDSRQQEVSDISRSLKALARELNVPVNTITKLKKLGKIVSLRPCLSCRLSHKCPIELRGLIKGLTII